MCDGGGGAEGKTGAGGGGSLLDVNFVHRLIMAAAVVLQLPLGPTPSNKAYNNQQTYYATGSHG
jgi:hypothetical protein